MMTQLTGAKQEPTAKLELDGYAQWYKEEQTRIQNVVTDFNANYEKYLSEFKEKMHLATEAQKTMLDIMNQGNANIDNASSEILQAGHNIATTLGQVNQLLQDSLDEINNKKNEDKTKDSRGKINWEKLGNWVEKADEGSTHDIGLKVMERGIENDDYGDMFTGSIAAQGGTFSAFDAVMSSKGSSMYTAADNVTPVNDGTAQLVKTHPQDTAIFAKTGGPFDTLFNGIFSKINEISRVMPKSLPYEFPEQSIKELYKPQYNHQTNSGNVSSSPIKVEPITLNINLDGALGKSKDFLEEITDNPMLVRRLSQLISESISKNIDGGKSIYTGGLPTPRFQKQ